MKGRNFCFTYHLPEDPQGDRGLLDPDTWEHCTFVVYQLEMCPDTGRLHYQGYLELSQQVRLTHLQSFEGLEGAHWEPRRGTQEQAILYCEKQESRLDGPWRHGSPKHQGERTDLLAIQKRIKEGASSLEIADDYFGQWIRYNKAFSNYKRLKTQPRDFKSVVILIVGPAGTGKSRFAHRLIHYLGPDHYKLPDKHTGLWCDDYAGQHTFFIDEMDGDRMRPKFFNELCDRYECILPAHGGFGNQFTSRYIVIVSNYLPKFWWRKRNGEQLKQTMRRIDVIIPMLEMTPSQKACTCVRLGICAIHHI